MNHSTLRALLTQRGALTAIRAAANAGDLARILPAAFFPHIGDVYLRLDLIAGSDVAEIAALRLAVLVHETAPAELPTLLTGAGFADLAPTIVPVISAFGQIWKITDGDELSQYVRGHRRHLAPILLFELAHEGQATAAMEDAARLGGLARAFASWRDRLRAASDAPPATA